MLAGINYTLGVKILFFKPACNIKNKPKNEDI